MLAAAAIEVSTKRNNHSHPAIAIKRAVDQRVKERGSFVGVLADGQSPNPACLATLHGLLCSGRDSPLYNPRIPVAELHTTLDEIRSGL
jgi:hypothetical protein